jgi:hypothetical protein
VSNKKDELDFEGKVISFSSAENTLAMMNIKFEVIKNRLFVVGEIPKSSTTNNWAVGRIGAIAWDSVTDYIVFDSELQYIELIEKNDTKT